MIDDTRPYSSRFFVPPGPGEASPWRKFSRPATDRRASGSTSASDELLYAPQHPRDDGRAWAPGAAQGLRPPPPKAPYARGQAGIVVIPTRSLEQLHEEVTQLKQSLADSERARDALSARERVLSAQVRSLNLALATAHDALAQRDARQCSVPTEILPLPLSISPRAVDDDTCCTSEGQAESFSDDLTDTSESDGWDLLDTYI